MDLAEKIIIALIIALAVVVIAVVGTRYYDYSRSHHGHHHPSPTHCVANTDCGPAAACAKGICVSIAPQIQAAKNAERSLYHMLDLHLTPGSGSLVSSAQAMGILTGDQGNTHVGNIRNAAYNVNYAAAMYLSNSPFTAYDSAMESITAEGAPNSTILAAVAMAPAAERASIPLVTSFAPLEMSIDILLAYVFAAAQSKGVAFDAQTKADYVQLAATRSGYAAMAASIQAAASNMATTAAVVAKALS
jgi:hypothetical protein